MTDLHLHLPQTSSSPKIKPPPKASNIPGPFFYSPSDDGTDENLLILLHGLGDTHIPFSKLGKSLNLPQTAILSLRAPQQIPFLHSNAWQWYPSFTPLGEPLTNPNPSPAIHHLSSILSHLIAHCRWRMDRIHWLGYAQGGSVGVEFALERWRVARGEGLGAGAGSSGTGATPPLSFASITSISGPLLTYPTLPNTSRCPTPLLIVYKPSKTSSVLKKDVAAFKKGFVDVTEHQMTGPKPKLNAKEEEEEAHGMPACREDWEPIMRFWSERLSKRPGEGLYEVLSGSSSV